MQMRIYFNLVEITEKCDRMAKMARDLKMNSHEILATAISKRNQFTMGNKKALQIRFRF